MGGGGKSGSKSTVGYKYYWDVQSGLGRGPVDEMVAITADEKYVFAGTEGQVNESMSLYIDKPDLFGGPNVGGEGGIQGTLEIAMGTDDQVPSENVKNLLGADTLIPGFRGMVTTFFSGLISAFSATPKPWSYRVRAVLKGWDGPVWYPEKALIRLENTAAEFDNQDSFTTEQLANLRTIHAMNPAHILMRAATDRDWGRGLSLENEINEASFIAAADTLYAEGFGLCFRYNRQDTLDEFVQQVLDHIGAAQYADVETGRLTLKLIRDDYVVSELPLFDYDSGIIDVQDDDNTTIDSAPNEIVVKWHDPATNEDGTTSVQNLGAIQAAGLISKSTEYPAIPTAELAERVAERDLGMNAAGLARLVIQFDRRGSALAPASVFRVSLPDRDIEDMVLRVGDIKEGDNGALTLTVVQDVFGLPSTSFGGGGQPSLWTPPDKIARPVTRQALIEIPYVLLAATITPTELAALPAESGFAAVMAGAPTPASVNYQLQSQVGDGDWMTRRMGEWTVTDTLRAVASPTQTTLSVSFTNGVPAVGSMVLLDSELLRVDAVDTVTGTLIVGRACGDTFPVRHPAGSVLWYAQDAIYSDEQEYLVGEEVSVRLLTRTSREILDASLATVMSLTLSQRQARPYLCGNIRINDVPYPETVALADSYVMIWAHRDRVLQADDLIDATYGDIGPEPGVTYQLSLIDVASEAVVWQTETTDNTLTLPYSTDEELAETAIHKVVLIAVRDGLTSRVSFAVNLPAGVFVESVESEPEPSEPTEEVTP